MSDDTTNCPKCNNAEYLWFDKGEWIIDSDDGMRGHVAKYCPNCGIKLETPSKENAMIDKETIKIAYMITNEAGETLLVEAGDHTDAIERAKQSDWLFDDEDFSIKKQDFIFKEEGFFSLHKDELHFPTVDDPMGQTSVVDKYWKTQELLAIVMLYTAICEEGVNMEQSMNILEKQKCIYETVSEQDVKDLFIKIRELKTKFKKEKTNVSI